MATDEEIAKNAEMLVMRGHALKWRKRAEKAEARVRELEAMPTVEMVCTTPMYKGRISLKTEKL